MCAQASIVIAVQALAAASENADYDDGHALVRWRRLSLYETFLRVRHTPCIYDVSHGWTW